MPRLLPAAVLISATAVLLTPGVAFATDPDQWAWVTERKPSTADYTPATKDRGSVANLANTVHRSAPGFYTVTFEGIANPIRVGEMIVTALSDQPRFCIQNDLGVDAPADVLAPITCYSSDGEAADSRFSVVFTSGGLNSGTYAFLLDNHPTQTDFTPDPNYAFNSHGGTNSVHRSGAGTYRVTLPGMTSAGNIQVTTASDGFCRILSWTTGVSATTVEVRCYSPVDASLSDQSFIVMYTRHVGLTGAPGRKAAYVYANKPTTASYTPPTAYRYTTGSTPKVKRTATGKYNVVLPGLPAGGAAAVTAVGAGTSRCQLTSIAGKVGQTVGVACFSPTGTPVDAEFMLSYTK
jgi:hypothetical protein